MTMKRLACWLVLAGSIAAGCRQSSAVGPSAATPTPSVSLVKPQRKSMPQFIEEPGTVQAYETTPLVAKLAGFVKKVNVDIGDRVVGPKYDSTGKVIEPGTVLAELSIPELEDEAREKQAQVTRAAAEKEQAERLVEVADAGYGAAQALVVEARAGLRRAQGNYARWESENNRVAKMVRERVVDAQTGDETQRQFVSAEAAREEATAHVGAVEKSVIKAKAEVGKARADVKAADAKRLVAEAEFARLHSLLGYRFIRAPFDGVVTERKVDSGHFVRPATGNEEPLFVVVRSNVVRVVLQVPEVDAALVRKEAQVKIAVQAAPGPELAGQVSRTSEALEIGSRTLRTEVDVPNPSGTLRPGMYVVGRIKAEMPEAWVLPAAAVVKQADVTVCFLFQDGKAVRTPIQSGRSDGKFTEVFKKQQPGSANWVDWTGNEEVLSGQAASLADGQAVEPTR